MTVSYHLELASVSSLSFLGILLRWKGSVWKHIHKELLIWTAIYLAISFFYRSQYFLNVDQKHVFEKLAIYLNDRLEYIPVTFILGFFVDTILSRWFDIFMNMGYIESCAIYIGNYIRGEDEDTRKLRRTLVRYMCLTQVLVFRDISVRVRKRFPTIESIVDEGILKKEEKVLLDSIKLRYNKYWAPIRWIHATALQACKEGRITSDLMYNILCAEIDKFRYNLQLLCNYDWVPIPLVYSQAVFLAVYVHFGICLISRQFLVTNAAFNSETDLILPLMTMIQFVFFIGWLKVAQALLNPFGDDDDDFECNYLIDKNLATGYCIADNYDRVPEVQPDRFWKRNKAPPTSTESPLVGSAVNAKLDLTAEQSKMVIRPPTRIQASASFDLGRKVPQILLTSSQSSEKLEVFSQEATNYKNQQRPRAYSSACIGDVWKSGLRHATTKDTRLYPYDYLKQQFDLLRFPVSMRQINPPQCIITPENNDYIPPDPITTNTKIEITRL